MGQWNKNWEHQRTQIATMLRPRIARLGLSLRLPHRLPQRSLHTVPVLPNWRDLSEGIPEFLSPAAVELAWTRYQALMVEKLNNLIAGM